MKFLRLSTVVINTAHVSHIKMLSKCYQLHLVKPDFSGFMIYGSGYISGGGAEVYTIQENTADYDLITKFIEEVSPTTKYK
jgi:hypothetical protein